MRSTKKIRQELGGRARPDVLVRGFTLAELVVTVGILGVLAAVALPKFSNLTKKTHAESNIANIHIIQQAFFQYYFRQHMMGNPHFPPPPVDGMMNSEWAHTPMLDILEDPDEKTPASLFSEGEVPMNSNHQPFYYEITVNISAAGVPSPTMTLRDSDPESPTYNQTFTFSL